MDAFETVVVCALILMKRLANPSARDFGNYHVIVRVARTVGSPPFCCRCVMMVLISKMFDYYGLRSGAV